MAASKIYPGKKSAIAPGNQGYANAPHTRPGTAKPVAGVKFGPGQVYPKLTRAKA